MKIKDELDSLDAQIDNILDSVDRTTEDYMYAVEEIAALRREVLDLRVNRIGLLRMIARLQRENKKLNESDNNTVKLNTFNAADIVRVSKPSTSTL